MRINRGKRLGLGLRIKKAVLPELTREIEEMIVRIKKEGETGSGGILDDVNWLAFSESRKILT